MTKAMMDLSVKFDPLQAYRALGEIKKWKPGAKQIDDLFGGFSKPSKMPGMSFNLPALKSCPTGTKLRKVKNSVCSKCYALKGRYAFPQTQNALERRLDCVVNTPHAAAAGIAYRLQNMNSSRRLWMRWHDSGDLLGPNHFEMLKWICVVTPETKHWLPTRESAVVRQSTWAPSNLCVRVSAHMIGAPPPAGFENTSTVGFDDAMLQCNAPEQDGQCLDCRHCWSTEISNINYKVH